ncbi:NAD(P)-binding protein [Artomyces pyxidatus]|uniref:NAD(P)-binding protein n=1 Tax=Artomyces pyxidatus TaxID=48021 RepID=A0ACB8T4R7_9AGAM|nr:NAD(P)-binding protein [Artomyces pyxidatus]
MSSIPTTQRAWRNVARGLPKDALQLVTDLPVPTELKPGYVLVKVEAAALNPIGYKLMKLLPNSVAGRPLTAEQDLAGVIVNGNGTKWSDGDAVMCFNPKGALAEYIAVPAAQCGRRPANITPVEAAGVPVCALTAHKALFEAAHLQEGQSLLINGGSTSVGAFAIQLAKAKGVKVTAIASGKNEEFCRKFGADEFIDYKEVDVPRYLSKNPPAILYNVILDAVGSTDPALYNHSCDYLAPGGVFVSVGPQPQGLADVPKFTRLLVDIATPKWLGGVRGKWTVISLKPDGKTEGMLEEISTLITEEKVKPVVDSVFTFEDTLKAYDRSMTGRATGKVVIKVVDAERIID